MRKQKNIGVRMLSVLLAATVALGCGATLSAIAAPVADSPAAESLTKNPLRLWYDAPAAQNHSGWENYSLPIGNGYLGGTVFGGIDTERVQFNEKTLWTGGPDEEKRPDYNYGILPGKETLLKEIQDLYAAGKDAEARAKTTQLTGVNGYGDGSFGAYQNFGDIFFDFGFDPEQVTNYVRELDLDTAIASVDYDYQGAHYTREYFASYPNNVMVMKFYSSQKAGMNFDIRMESAQGASTTAQGDTLIIRDKLADNNLQYESQLKVIPQGGTVSGADGKLTVSDADSVVIIMTAGTNYANDYPVYRGEDPHDAIVARIDAASKKSYDELKEIHLADYQEIFSRVDLNLGHEEAQIPTDQLLANYKRGDRNRYLETLLFQYGRYMTIASSREGTLPSNLQGVWNDSNSPAWSSDYHMNVNLQMNYWPTYSTNMAECAPPLIEYIDSLREPGRLSAAAYTGVESTEENPENGYTIHVISNPFGWSAPGWGVDWGWAPGCTPWILQNVWDYYDYTRDVDYLRETIYPMMKEQAKFWQQYLVYNEDTGRMEEIPSISSEQPFVSEGATYGQELSWQLFSDTIEAAEILGVDEDLRAEWAALKEQLDPLQIGDDGQIKEWYEETTLGSIPGSDRHHRHLSHLLGLFPGDHITPETPEFMEAAKVSLNDRGDNSTGWAMGHRLNLWARTGDGNRTYDLINALMKSGIYNNLWDSHPPFQIDGNFGYTSGVAEMLLQSHLGYIEFLPAIPDEWANGYVDGLVARGNFEIDMDWSDGSLTQAEITSRNGGTCTLRYENICLGTLTKEDGTPVEFTVEDNNTISFETEKDATYRVSQIPASNLPAPGTVEAYRSTDNTANLSWSPVEGADGYQVYRQINDGPVRLIASDLKETTFQDNDASIYLGEVSYQVAAVFQGRISALSTPAKPVEICKAGFVNDNNSSIQYSNGWAYWEESNYKGGSCHYINSATTGDQMSLKFYGTGVELYTTKYSNGCSIDVFVDGVKKAENISLKSDRNEFQFISFTETDLQPGIHTVTMVVNRPGKIALEGVEVLDSTVEKVTGIQVNTKTGASVIGAANTAVQMEANVQPASASNQQVSWSVTAENGASTSLASIDSNGVLTTGETSGTVKVTATAKDGSGVTGSKLITIQIPQKETVIDVDDRNSDINYASNWATWNENKHHDGTITYTTTEGDSIEYTFNGTGIEVYTPFNPTFAYLDLYLDNEFVKTLDLYVADGAGIAQQCAYSNRQLESGEHTIRLVVKNRDGKTKMEFDYFKVFQQAESVVDKTQLQAELNRTESLIETNYTAESWGQFQQVMSDAVAVMNQLDASADDIAAATAALQNAIDNVLVAQPDTTAPTAPAQVTANGVEETTALLTWSPSTDLSGIREYQIYTGDELVATTGDCFFRIENLEANTSYTYQVAAVDTNGNVSSATEVSFTTLEPMDTQSPQMTGELNLEVISSTELTLSWDEATDNKAIAYYEIYLNGQWVGTTKDCYYALDNLAAGAYTVIVRAADTAGNFSPALRLSFQMSDAVADRTILNKVIAKAEALLESDEFAGAISSVQESYRAVLAEAHKIAGNPSATQEQIDAAWVSLMTEIHKLGIQQGNKDLLKEHVELYSQLNLDLYIDGDAKDNFVAALEAAKAMLENTDAVQSEVDAADSALIAAANALVKRGDKSALQSAVDSTSGYVEDNYAKGWAEFEAARDAANAVLENPNATQEQVDEATDNLISAMLELRFKADKTLLNAVIAAAERIDLSSYSAQSVEQFDAALAQAKAVAADETLTAKEDQAVVDKAAEQLKKAVQGLKNADGTSANLSIDGDGTLVKTNSAKTGDTAPLAAAAIVLLAGAALILKKRTR